MKIDRDAIRDLAEILKDTDLTEIEVEEKDLKIRVARQITQGAVQYAPMHQPVHAPAQSQSPSLSPESDAAPAVNDSAHAGAIKSPMVGTAYHAPEPGAANFVAVGDKVAAGDTIMIVEAMKVMNPIKATKAGTVKKIVAQDASPVEFGDVLAIIE